MVAASTPTQTPKEATALNGSAIAHTACERDGSYTVQLTDGTIIAFTGAAITGEWLRLFGCLIYGGILPSVAVCASTIEIRIADIRLICGEAKSSVV